MILLAELGHGDNMKGLDKIYIKKYQEYNNRYKDTWLRAWKLMLRANTYTFLEVIYLQD